MGRPRGEKNEFDTPLVAFRASKFYKGPLRRC
jgi:hypothetical protein